MDLCNPFSIRLELSMAFKCVLPCIRLLAVSDLVIFISGRETLSKYIELLLLISNIMNNMNNFVALSN